MSYVEKYRAIIANLKEDQKNSIIHPVKNPVAKNLKTFSEKGLVELIQQYAHFTNRAIKYLLECRIRQYKWKILSDEINYNIQEELGSKTSGVPHLEMMRQGFTEIGIETDNTRMYVSTLKFLNKMDDIFSSGSMGYIAGALLAFESVSVHEFDILDMVLKRYESLTDKKSETAYLYVNGHKKFEIDHEKGLETALENYIDLYTINDFLAGYEDIIHTMEMWWKEMAQECAR